MIRFLKYLSLVLFLFITFILFLPTILSTQWGKKQALAWVNFSIPGKIAIDDLSTQWGSGQAIKGFKLQDSEGNLVLEFKEFFTEATFFQLLLRDYASFGFINISELNGNLAVNADGQSNLESSLFRFKSSPTINASNSPSISVSNINGACSYRSHQPFEAKFTGLTGQGNLQGGFDIHLAINSSWDEITGEHYFERNHNQQDRLNAQVNNFPVDLLDQLFALKNPELKGLLRSIFGESIHLSLKQKPSDEGISFDINFISPLVKTAVIGIIKKEILVLEPTRVQFKLTPNSLLPLTQDIKILSETSGEIGIVDCNIPHAFFKKNGDSDPCLFGFKFELKVKNIEAEVRRLEKIAISNFQGVVSSQKCDKFIQVEMIGNAENHQQPFDLHFTSTLSKPENIAHFNENIYLGMHTTVTVSKLPLRLIPFFNDHSQFTKNFGSTVNAQLDIQPSDHLWKGIFSFQTPQMILEEAKLEIGKELKLTAPASIKWNATSSCLKDLFAKEQLQLDQPCPIHLVLERFKMPFNNPNLLEYECVTTIDTLRLPYFLKGGIPLIENCKVKIDGKSLKNLSIQLTSQFNLLSQQGNPLPLFSEPLQIQSNSKWIIDEQGLEMSEGKSDIKNADAHLIVEGELKGESITLTQPLKFEYLLTPEALANVCDILGKNCQKIKEKSLIHLEIEPTEFNLKQNDLAHLYLQGILEIKKIVLKENGHEPSPVLENLVIPWVIDGPRNNIYTSIKGLAYTERESKPSQISAHLQFWLNPNHIDMPHTRSEIRMNFNGMPTSMLNVFYDLPNLNLILGPILDLDLKLFYDPEIAKPGYFDMVLDSTHFHLEGRYKLSNRATIYDPNKPPLFKLTISPNSYQALKVLTGIKDDRELKSPFLITGILNQVNVPIVKNWTHQSQLNCNFFTSNILWKDSNDNPLKIEGNIVSKNLESGIELTANATEKTVLKVSARADQLFDATNNPRTFKDLSFKFHIEGDKMTPRFIRSLFPITLQMKEQINAILGDEIDLLIDSELIKSSGPILASIKGNQGNIRLEGVIHKGLLTLRTPLAGFTNLSPLFIQTLLTPNVPLLKNAVASENPLSFKIEKLICPLDPFQFENVIIEKGEINFGKIIFRNEGDLPSILAMIKPISGKTFNIWFTPIYFDLNKGIFSLKRLDMLIANAYTLANWGAINLNNHEGEFILGIPSETLEQVIGSYGLDPNYILQIPIHMKQGKVDINRQKAIARIGSLVAQTHGGTKGKIIGGLVDTFLSEKEETYPSPTTQPFPWQGEFKPSSFEPNDHQQNDEPDQSAKNKKKKNKAIRDETLNTIRDGALQLLDRIIK